MHRNSVRAILVAAVSLLSLLAATSAFAKKPHFPVTMEQARAAALKAVPGATIKSGELEKEHGKWIYSFDLKSGKEIREVWVDPNTGAVLQNEVESAREEKAEAAAEKPHFPVTMERARAAALKAVPGGTIMSGELEKEQGKWIYSFDVKNGDEIREVWVDPKTGAIFQNEVESAARGKAEAAAEKK